MDREVVSRLGARARLTILAVVFALPATAAATKTVVMPLQIDPTATTRVPAIMNEVLLTAAQAAGHQVVGTSDLELALAHNVRQQLVGCDEPGCLAQIATALKGEKLLSVHVAFLSDQWLITGKLIDVQTMKADNRASAFVQSDVGALAKAFPPLVNELFKGVAPAKVAYQCRYDKVAECREQCDAGHLGSCYSLAHAYDKGNGVRRDESKAFPLYGRLCEAGHVGACSGLGYFHSKGLGGAVADPVLAVKLHRKACDANHPRGCYNLATYYVRGSGGLSKDLDRAVALYERACEGSDFYCGGIGSLYADGKGVAKNNTKAVSYLDRACEAGGIGCSQLGFHYRDGKGVMKDLVKALFLFERSCDTDGIGCHAVGNLYAAGQGVNKDAGKAVEYYRRGCDRGFSYPCFSLGRAFSLGEGVAKDDAQAAARFELACDKGMAKGCASLGMAFELGVGVKADPARAAELLAKACELGDRRSCP